MQGAAMPVHRVTVTLGAYGANTRVLGSGSLQKGFAQLLSFIVTVRRLNGISLVHIEG